MNLCSDQSKKLIREKLNHTRTLGFSDYRLILVSCCVGVRHLLTKIDQDFLWALVYFK